MSAFAPAGTISLAVTSSTGAAKLTNVNPQAVRVYNAGTAVAFIKAGDSTVTAATTDLPIAPGVVEVLDMKATFGTAPLTHIAGITSSGTATVYFTCGQGS
jgi:hypothetical protein